MYITIRNEGRTTNDSLMSSYLRALHYLFAFDPLALVHCSIVWNVLSKQFDRHQYI